MWRYVALVVQESVAAALLLGCAPAEEPAEAPIPNDGDVGGSGATDTGAPSDASAESLDPCPGWPMSATWIGPDPVGAIMARGRIVAGGRESPHEAHLSDGTFRELDGSLRGALVKVKGMDGTTLSQGLTSCGGNYAIPAPASSRVLIEVAPVSGPDDGYTGFQLVMDSNTGDLFVYDMDMLPVAELTTRLAAIGRTYDKATGWVIQSFASAAKSGGEGVTVSGVPSEGYFAVTQTHTLQTSILPASCPAGTAGVPLGDPVLDGDGGVKCWTDLLPMIFVSSVPPGDAVTLSLSSPLGFTCTPRIDQSTWVIRPNTVMRVFADCSSE